METTGSLTPTSVLSEAQRHLAHAGYVIKRVGLEAMGISPERCLLAEDRYSVVLVAAYSAWHELSENWIELQDSLVDALSVRVTRGNPKAWDAYLVLLCTGDVTPDEKRAAGRIRQDTSRTRKLVAVGDELRTLDDVQRAIAPMLPITIDDATHPATDPLSDLPRLLKDRGIDETAATTVVEAFRSNRPILDDLDRVLRSM